MVEIIQPSFAKGEIGPQLYGRVDTQMYGIGLARARNTVVHTYGGISKRPGLRYIGPVKDHSYNPRLVEFQFKTTDTYILEFGDMYMRVIRNDAPVLTALVDIATITNSNPATVTTIAPHGWVDGQEIFIYGVSGMFEVNIRHYIIKNASGSEFTLTDQVTGQDVDSTSWGTYTSGGTAGLIYEISTPYKKEDLFNLTFIQSADVMTIANVNYPVYELSRFDNDDWRLVEAPFEPQIAAPVNFDITVNTSGTVEQEYAITAIDKDTQEESLAGLKTTGRVITNITNSNPAIVTTSTAVFRNGDELYIQDVVGMTEINDQRYIAQNVNDTSFELFDLAGEPVDSTAWGTYISGGLAFDAFIRSVNNSDTPDNTFTWNSVTNASKYLLYRKKAGVFGFIGEASDTTFTDKNFNPDTSLGPPSSNRNPFDRTGRYPGAVGYYEQRRVFGNTNEQPDTSWFSQTGNQSNFTAADPIQPDDSFSATLASQQVNEIRHYVGQNDLLVFTSGSEWRVNSGPDQRFEPDTVQFKPQSEWGCSNLRPILTGNTILFITDDGANIRSLGYSLELDGYTGANLNILSQHLTLNKQILDWTHIHIPEGRIYMVRNDGILLTMSFNPEQEVIAWTTWDTQGKFESCRAMRGGGPANEDSLYVVVSRFINGQTVRYIELARQFNAIEQVEDAFFVDSGLTYDNPKEITNVVFGATTTIEAPSHGFSNGDEVEIRDIEWAETFDIRFNSTQPDQINQRRYIISNVTTDTFDIPVDSTGFSAYVFGGKARKTVTKIYGLHHLEGETLSTLLDGGNYDGLTVVNGSVDLPIATARVQTGLRYITDIVTLNIEVPQGTIQSYKKHIPHVYVRYYQSVGLLIGPNENDLDEVRWREFELMGEPPALLSGDHRINLSPDWNSKGRIYMRHIWPTPLTLLAVIPSVEVGEE